MLEAAWKDARLIVAVFLAVLLVQIGLLGVVGLMGALAEGVGMEITKETHPEEHDRMRQLFRRSKEILGRWPDDVHLRRSVRTYTFNRPFPVVDAALWEFFIIHNAAPAWTIKRSTLTTGSATYQFYYSKQNTRSAFELRPRMLNADTTLLYTELAQDPEPQDLLLNIGQQLTPDGQPDLSNPSVELIAIIRRLGDTFSDWMNEEEEQQNILQEMARIMHGVSEKETPILLPSTEVSETLDAVLRRKPRPGKGTHTSWAEDDWAWEQVNVQKRPRQEVRGEWLQRLSENRPALRDQARSFRHAVNPERKGSRKPEG